MRFLSLFLTDTLPFILSLELSVINKKQTKTLASSLSHNRKGKRFTRANTWLVVHY